MLVLNMGSQIQESGIGEGDEVVVPTVSFISPVNTVKYVCADPVFMDCDDYLNMDMKKLEEFLKRECEFKDEFTVNKNTRKRVKAVIPVHVFGHPVDIEHLTFLAEKFNLVVIEDAAESLGSYYINGKYKGKMTGTIGDLGCFSFNGNKIITTGGGGMIVSDEDTCFDSDGGKEYGVRGYVSGVSSLFVRERFFEEDWF